MTNATLIRRTTIVETYVEITPARQPEPATVKARVVEPAPIPAPAAKPTTGQAPAIGDRVLYTSKGGRTAEYRVFWVGEGDKAGRIGLKRPYVRGENKGFFVAADACQFLRHGR